MILFDEGIGGGADWAIDAEGFSEAFGEDGFAGAQGTLESYKNRNLNWARSFGCLVCHITPDSLRMTRSL